MDTCAPAPNRKRWPRRHRLALTLSSAAGLVLCSAGLPGTGLVPEGVAASSPRVSSVGGTIGGGAGVSTSPVVQWGRDDSGQGSPPPEASNVVAIAAGLGHSLALRTDGTVVAWGLNSDGQATVPAEATNVVAIAAGHVHSLALRSDGTVVGWGLNNNGQATAPARATNVVAISASLLDSMALRADGTVVIWGINGDLQQNSIPAAVSNVVAIAAGWDAHVALRADGQVAAWGDNGWGQLNVPAEATNLVAVAAGILHCTALRADGTALGWGFGVGVPADAINLAAVSDGGYHELGLRPDGSVMAWGNNAYGQTNVPAAATNVVAVAAGSYHSLALLRDPAVQLPPRIWAQPTDRTAIGGSTIVMHAGAAGSPPLGFQWRFNGAPLPDQTNQWLTLSNINPGHAGGYSVAAGNPFGSVTSATAVVTVIMPAAITAQPQNQAAGPGGTVSFSVTGTGTEPLAYQWYFNGTNLMDDGRVSGTTTTRLQIENVQGADAGDYTVVLSNAANSVTSAVATLTVSLPPSIATQPTNQTVDLHQSLTLVVSAGGTEPLFYRWRKERVALTNDGRVTGATSPGLTIADVQPQDDGAYDVVVSNSYGAVTSLVATVRVLREAAITTQPVDQYVLLTRTATFAVATKGAEPLSYQWFFGGGPLFDDDRRSGATSATLVIENVQASDAGGYWVVVSNTWGAVTSSIATLTIAAVRYVNVSNPNPSPPYTNWATAATVIQQAIDTAGPGDEILVTNGVYKTGGRSHGQYFAASRVALDKPLAVISVNGPEVTTIMGNTYPYYAWGRRPAYLTNGALLAGFTLTGGDAELGSTDPWNQRGGGVLCESLSAVVSNCIISGNVAGRYGGGAFSGTLINCKIIGNAVRDHSGGRIGDGGGAYSSTLKNCVVLNNYARMAGGGALWGYISDCVIAGNSALQGGGALGGHLVNCTVVGNSAPTDGGVGGGVGGGVLGGTAVNSIIVENHAWLGQVDNWRSATLSYCCTSPDPGGVGNITDDPAFIDFAGGNYRLQSNSPCINIGSNEFVTSSVDVDGRPRVVDGVVDMGAHEYQRVPWVVTDPASQGVLIESNVTFTVLALGDEPLAYQWEKDGVSLVDVGRISGAATRSLTISPVLAEDAGTYRVVVTNVLGKAASRAAELTILFPPSILVPPASQIVAAGTNVTFAAAASGTAPLAYQWYKDGNGLADGGNVSGVATPTLLVTNVGTNDAGSYHVVVTSPYGIAASTPATLSILPLAITAQPSGQSAPAGTNVTFAVSAAGTATIFYQWRFNRSPLEGATNPALILINVQASRAGDYDVVVTNAHGALTSRVAVLTVVPSAPWITAEPASRVVSVGQTISLLVAAQGTEPLSCQWQRNGSDIPGANDFTLELGRMNSSLAGVYRAVVSNSLGERATSNAVLTVAPVRVWGPTNALLTAIPAAATNLIDVAAGRFHAIALRADGTVVGWNVPGQVDSGQANPPPTATNVVALAAGSSHSVALRGDGTVVAWGGFGAVTNVPATATNVVAIDAKAGYTLALRDDGTVVYWGVSRTLAPLPPWVTNVVAMAAGYDTAMALRADGSLFSWGSSKIEIPPSATNVVALSGAGSFQQQFQAHFLWLRSDGSVLAAGDNSAGQCNVPPEATNAVAIAAGGMFSLALREDGTVVGWGSTVVPPDLTNATRIAAGMSHGLALVRDPFTAPVPPRMGREPSGRAVLAGESVVLHALAVGPMPLRYQWFHDGILLPDGTNSWLALENAHPSQAGNYQVVASDAFNSVTSVVASVSVGLPGPVLASPGRAANSFWFSFTSVAGVTYVVEYQNILNAGAWTELERRLGAGGVEIITDPSVGDAMRFYRVRALAVASPGPRPVLQRSGAVDRHFPTAAGAAGVAQ